MVTCTSTRVSETSTCIATGRCAWRVAMSQVLAINRGESAKVLCVKVVVPDWVRVRFGAFCCSRWTARDTLAEQRALITASVEQTYKKRIQPRLERQYRWVPASTGEYRRVPASTGEYRRVPASAGECRRVSASAGECRRVPASTGEYRRVPASAGECRRVPTCADEYRRVSRGPGRVSGTASERVSRATIACGGVSSQCL